MSDIRQICTFLLGDRLFGLDVNCVLEVIRSQMPTPVPLAPGSLEGLINLRGSVIPSINLHRRLSLSTPVEAAAEAAAMSMVIRTNEGPICFRIDEVGDVLELEQSSLEPVPENLSGVAKAMLESVCQLPSRLLLVLKSEVGILSDSQA